MVCRMNRTPWMLHFKTFQLYFQLLLGSCIMAGKIAHIRGLFDKSVTFWISRAVTLNTTLLPSTQSMNRLLLNLEQAGSFSLCLTAIESTEPREFERKWKKVNIVCWLSTIFCVKKPSLKPRKGLINTMGTLHHQFQCLRSGLLSSVVVVPAQVTPNVQVVQKRSSRQISSIKSMEWYWMIGEWKCVRWLRL